MHALLICRSFPHHRAGGMEWHVQDIADGLMEAGHTVSVVTTPLPEAPRLQALKINGTVIEAGHNSGEYDPWFFIHFIRRVREQVSDLKPDIIHAQGFAGLPARRYLRDIAPVVTTIHGTLWSETPLRGKFQSASLAQRWRFKHRYLFAPLWRDFLKSAPPLIVDSQFTTDELRRERAAYGDGHHVDARIVPLGFDLERFQRASDGREARRRAWEIKADQFLIASIGRLNTAKNPMLIAGAFAELAGEFPQARLIIGGDGPEKKRMMKTMKIRALVNDGKLILTGHLSPLRVAALLEAADLFVNADRSAPAFGLANAEALVMGTPVLAFDVGAHAEVVGSDAEGILVPEGNVQEFAAALRKVVSVPPENVAQRSERACAARERFQRGRMIDRLVSTYEEIQRS